MATVRSTAVPSLTIVARGPLSTAEQLDALRRTEAQADLRMKIGVQLVKAAEAQATQQQSILTQVKAQQDTLRQQISADVAATLVQYDHQITRIDDNFTQRLQGLEDRIDGLARHWEQSRRKIDRLLDRADTLLDESDAGTGQEVAAGGSTPPMTVNVKNETANVPVLTAEPLPSPVTDDPHAGATVAPPTAIDPALDFQSAPEGLICTDPQKLAEPCVRFSDILDKLDTVKPV